MKLKAMPKIKVRNPVALSLYYKKEESMKQKNLELSTVEKDKTPNNSLEKKFGKF
jgi:hypothetical protein